MAVEQCWESRLIEEVRKRPQLWDHQQFTENNRCDELWNEIGQVLHVEVNFCKTNWEKLHSQFCNEVKFVKKRIAKAKKAGSYDPSKKYFCLPYFDDLRFIAAGSKLDLSFENSSDKKTQRHLFGNNSVKAEGNNDIEMKERDNSVQTVATKFRIIKEVQKRRAIWDFKHLERGALHSAALWTEIGQVLDIDVITCKKIWSILRSNYRQYRAHIPKRIAKAKKAGTYDPNKTYSNWLFFDALKFLEDGISLKRKADPKLSENTNADQILTREFDSNSLQTGTTANDSEMLKSDNLTETTVEKCRLIEEVRKRPILWDYRLIVKKSRTKCKQLWNEIAQVLNAEVYTCRQTWDNLHIQFCDEAASVEKRVVNAKEEGSYDPNKKYYSWPYFDHFRFIVDGSKAKFDIEVVTSDNTDQMESSLDDNNLLAMESDSDQTANKLQLIEEVRKRPPLWDITREQEISHKKHTELWHEVAQILNVDVNICKQIWKSLRTQFRNEILHRIPKRIANAKEVGDYDPYKKYHNWLFFDALRFMEKRYPPKERVDPKTVESNSSDQRRLDLLDNSSRQTESENGFEMSPDLDKLRLIEEVRKRPELWNTKLGVGTKKRRQVWNEIGQILDVDVNTCRETFIRLRIHFRTEDSRRLRRIARAKREGSYNPNKTYSNWPLFDALKFIPNVNKAKICGFANNSGSNSFQTENNIDIDTAVSDHDNVQNASLLEDHYENDSFGRESECQIVSNKKTVMQIDAVVKQEAELQIEMEKYPLENADIAELEADDSLISLAADLNEWSANSDLFKRYRKREDINSEQFITSSCDAKYIKTEYHNASTLSDHVSNGSGLYDEDYNFLCSFLSQVKALNPVQKLEFRLDMEKFLAHTPAACPSANNLENQLLLLEDHDPDRKFLIRFWPFIKSMTMLQNLQFRAKIPHLLLKSLSHEISQHHL